MAAVVGRAPLRVLSRTPMTSALPVDTETWIGDLTTPDTIRSMCDGVDTVFHLASYAPAAGDVERAEMHQRVTVDGTSNLIDEAIAARVRRFVFLSTVKAIDEGGEECRDEQTAPNPQSAYGRAKLAAEQMILSRAAQSGMEAVVLRLPVVYGPRAKGNFARMLAAIARGRFPPLPETHNRRSMVHVQDVVRASLLAARHPQAVGKVYIVTDGLAYSTRQIYERMCEALGLRAPRWSIPATIFRTLARTGDAVNRVAGRPLLFDSDAWQKLLGSAWYSSAKIERELMFAPTQTFWDALPHMAEQYRRR